MHASGLPLDLAKLTGLTLVAGILLLFLFVFIHAWLVYLGAAAVGIAGRTFGKALATTLVYGLLMIFLNACLVLFLGLGVGLGLLGGFLVLALVMMNLFETTFSKALLAAVMSTILGAVIAVGLFLLLALITGGTVALGLR